MYKGPPYNSIGHSQEALDNHFPTLSQKFAPLYQDVQIGPLQKLWATEWCDTKAEIWMGHPRMHCGPFYACMCKETQLGIFARPHGHACHLQPILMSIIHHIWTLAFCSTSRIGNHQIRQNFNQRGTPLGKETRGWVMSVWSFEALCCLWYVATFVAMWRLSKVYVFTCCKGNNFLHWLALMFATY